MAIKNWYINMNYISLLFVAFLACLLVAYALTPNKYKWIVLLVFSLVFYASNGLDKLAFVLGTSVVVYAASRKMQSIWQEYDKAAAEVKGKATPEERKLIKKKYTAKSKRVLLLAMAVSLGILCWCKFSLKAIGLFNSLTGQSVALSIIVPLGISYYTFSSVGYLVDIHWQTVEAEKNYGKLLLCMIYFPHVVEGPIPRYERLLPQFDKLTFPDYDRFCKGAQLALWGLFKKMVVADRLGIFVNSVFGNVAGAWGFVYPVALVFAAFQMYADFSGCMDIITGISDIVGVKLDKNFEQPFLSRTVTEFWRRWHISLFNWLKDYIYMPLLTSRFLGKFRKAIKKKCSAQAAKTITSIIPTACVFLIIGLWHDVGWRYVIHGLYWTVLFVLSTAFEDKLSRIPGKLHLNTDGIGWRCFQTLRTFALYAISYITFTPKTMGDVIAAVRNTFSTFNPWVFFNGTLYNYGLNKANLFLGVLCILFLIMVDIIQERCVIRDKLSQMNIVVRWAVYFAGIFAVIIFGMYGPGYNAAAFIYQQF